MTPPKDITPGEWQADGSDIWSGENQIATAEMRGTTNEEDLANARMMAASKELAEALNDLLDNQSSLVGFIQKARAALLKSGYTP